MRMLPTSTMISSKAQPIIYPHPSLAVVESRLSTVVFTSVFWSATGLGGWADRQGIRMTAMVFFVFKTALEAASVRSSWHLHAPLMSDICG